MSRMDHFSSRRGQIVCSDGFLDFCDSAVGIVKNVSVRHAFSTLNFIVSLAVLFLSGISANGRVWISGLESVDYGSGNIFRSYFLLLGKQRLAEQQSNASN